MSSIHLASKKLLSFLSKNQTVSITSDWIIGETCTLLTVRNKKHLATQLLDIIDRSRANQVNHISEELFDNAKKFFTKRADKNYSFTDCTSFVLMRSLKIKVAATEDTHFNQEGFNASF